MLLSNNINKNNNFAINQNKISFHEDFLEPSKYSSNSNSIKIKQNLSPKNSQTQNNSNAAPYIQNDFAQKKFCGDECNFCQGSGRIMFYF